MVSGGFRISSHPIDSQEDQALTDAGRGKSRHYLRESATSRNQNFNVNSGSDGTDENAQNVAQFKAVIKSPTEHLTQHALDEESAGKSEDEE